METDYYKCETCGYIHQVPSYWSGHSPEDSMEMQHLNLATKEICDELILSLIQE